MLWRGCAELVHERFGERPSRALVALVRDRLDDTYYRSPAKMPGRRSTAKSTEALQRRPSPTPPEERADGPLQFVKLQWGQLATTAKGAAGDAYAAVRENAPLLWDEVRRKVAGEGAAAALKPPGGYLLPGPGAGLPVKVPAFH